jgi:hypothetical protein
MTERGESNLSVLQTLKHPMPRYHLNLHNGHGPIIDEDGADFVDLASARQRAVQGIRSLLSHEVLEGRIDLRGHLDIVDETGVTVAAIAFADTIKIVQSRS